VNPQVTCECTHYLDSKAEEEKRRRKLSYIYSSSYYIKVIISITIINKI